MAETFTISVGARGTLVIPQAIRQSLGIGEGSLLLGEVTGGGIVLRRAVAVPVEKYTLERKAEFLLNNAIDKEDYAKAVKAVRAMGVDPASIPHERPHA